MDSTGRYNLEPCWWNTECGGHVFTV